MTKDVVLHSMWNDGLGLWGYSDGLISLINSCIEPLL